MTRANAEQSQSVPWFAKAGAACSIVPIARFVNEHLFALKGGGYGCLFTLTGLDEECLTDQELDAHLRMVEGALRGLPEGACLYQYSRVRSGFELPKRNPYPYLMTDVIVGERLRFLDQQAGFRRMDIHWCLTIEPSKVKAFDREPKENAFATSRMLTQLEKTATLLAGNLGGLLGLQLLSKDKSFQFFSYLFNLEDWAEQDHLRTTDGVDRQIVKSPVHWESDHLRIGKQFVQMFSLQMTPEASRPCLFSDLAKLDCDSILCSTWRPKSTTAARDEIDRQEKFIEFFKVGVVTRVMSGRDFASLDKGAGARAANNQVDDLGDVIRSLDKKAQGEFSLRLLIATRSRAELLNVALAVHRVLVEARAQVMEETLGNLSAFYAMFPGNGKFNVFPLWLAEDHNARLASVFAPHLGHPHSEDLDQEYLNVFETRTGTPFFQDAYVDGVRVQLIIGPTGSGKTTVLSSVREGAERIGLTVEGFAPTSRASSQLREAGIDATTLQSFLARGESHPARNRDGRHLYMLDESSLASTRQMREFLDRLGPNDRVLVIGDTRQHQGVDAGRPFQQMQEFGMRTSNLDRIMRQKVPDLLRAVEHLSRNETREGIALLKSQGRITEFTDRRDRIAAIARDYAARPDNTIVVSPDNQSRRDINAAIREELTRRQLLDSDSIVVRTLTHRSDMTGADRTWAARYDPGDVVQYASGSKVVGIERGEFATVRAVDSRANLLTVELRDGTSLAYDPRRLRGVNVFHEEEREFATKDRVQFTTPLKDFGVANRGLGTIERLEGKQMTVRLDGKEPRTVTFNIEEVRQIDHGYAVTSHSSQGLTAGRVLAHFDTDGPRALINTRLAYVAISRASEDARIYTNDMNTLGRRLASDLTKTAAIEVAKEVKATAREQAVSAFRQHDPRAVPSALQRDRKVHEFASVDHRLAAVARAYGDGNQRTVVFAPDAAERREVTDLIRDELRQRGLLSQESHPITVLVERPLEKPRVAASYLPGDQIHYKTGSPTEHGIADHSIVQVLSVDAKANRIVVKTLDGIETSYNPALLRVQTDQSRVFREEKRDISIGERIIFTQPDKALHIRRGELGSVEAIQKDLLIVKRDSGESIALSEAKMRHIDHGYALPQIPKTSPERIIVTGNAELLDRQQISSISPRTRDVQLYISDSRLLSQQLQALGINHLSTRATERSLPAPEIGR